jgi:glycosyltransferase involved in cell wall biosynthesis
MKVAVYTITKNESQFITRWAESAKEADYLLVADTGSDDDTVETAIKSGCEVAELTISPWRFDDARNASLSLIPDDIDWCIALDADEVLQAGWRNYIEKLVEYPEEVTRPYYKYVWSWNEDDSEGLVYYGDKIHKRHGYRWKHPVHETLTPVGIQEIRRECPGLEIHHLPDHTKSRSHYLPLLEQAVQESPQDDRLAHYLGREYVYTRQYDRARQELLRHLDLPSATWKPERAASMRYLAQCGDREHWLLRACAEDLTRREPWIDLAELYYEQRKWSGCYAAIERALQITEKPLEYICEARSWSSYPYDIGSIAAYHLGLKDIAKNWLEEAITLSPEDQRLRKNLEEFYS